MNKTYSLIAFGLLFLLISPLAGLQALFEVLERVRELFSFLEINGDDLVDAHELLGNHFFQVGEPVLEALLQGSLHVVHSLEDVQDFFFTDT